MSVDEYQTYQSCGYAYDGGRIVCAGDKPSIEIFDEENMQLIHRFEKFNHPTHTNKVFVAKFYPKND